MKLADKSTEQLANLLMRSKKERKGLLLIGRGPEAGCC